MRSYNRWAVFEGSLPDVVVIDMPAPLPFLIFEVAGRLPENLHQRLFDYLFNSGRMRFIRVAEIGEDGRLLQRPA